MGELGRFDSWNIKSSHIATKDCDKSFFEHNGSGVPSQVRYFFDAENMENGTNMHLILVYEGEEYSGRITKDKYDSGRTRIFWPSELGKKFREKYSHNISNAIATFERVGNNKYKVSMSLNNEVKEDKMRKAIDKFLNGYLAAKETTFAGHPFGTFVRNELPNTIYNTGLVDTEKYLVTGSVGQGNWAAVPWVCIFDREITTSATKGVYIVYLLSKDGKSLYLTFNQGCTEIRKNNSKIVTIRIMREKASEIASRINSRGFRSDEDINLGDGLTELAEMYQKGTIFYKEYKQGNVPSEQELYNDLSKMMDIYKDYVKGPTQKSAWLLTWNPNNWEWKDYNKAIKDIKSGKIYIEKWSCVNTHVEIGDRVFLIMLGLSDKNGIMASGYANSTVYEAEHWDEQKKNQGIKAKRIDVKFDTILDYESEEILMQSELNVLFPEQQWSPQGSGITIKEEYRNDLEARWTMFAKKEGEEELSTKKTIEQIEKYIAEKGFSYDGKLIENFYLSIKSKPFVILAGTSGTGKTKLVKLFAEAIGAKYKLISVRPDWSDSSDLFGHTNLKGDFVPGAIIDYIKEAKEHQDYPYFLCLDEMNLARVEYYLSDFLSLIETRKIDDGKIVTESIELDKAAEENYKDLYLPENLYFIGTVNMDETTFPFSKKVLDRANTIEFSYVDLVPSFDFAEEMVYPVPQNNKFLKTEYITLKTDIKPEQRDLVVKISNELQSINEILRNANAHVGYRVRDEIVFYMLNNAQFDLLRYEDAMDNEIMQKILPRLQGSSMAIKELLINLFKKFAGDYTGLSQDMIWKQMEAYIESKDCVYKKSAEKVCYMMRRYEEDGFTSYWI